MCTRSISLHQTRPDGHVTLWQKRIAAYGTACSYLENMVASVVQVQKNRALNVYIDGRRCIVASMVQVQKNRALNVYIDGRQCSDTANVD